MTEKKTPDYVPLKNPYGARQDWSMDKRVVNLPFKVDVYMHGGVERSIVIPIETVEELKAMYQLNTQYQTSGELK